MKYFKQCTWLVGIGMLFTLSAMAQPNLTRVEYYIDSDPGYGNGISLPITPGPDLNALSYMIDFTSLSTGVHLVGMRSQNSQGAWSHDNKWLFAKLSAIAGEGPVPNLSKTEYYIDTDPGYGNGTAVNIAPGPKDGTGSFTLDITNMSTGVHLIGIRTKDANGGWSHDNKWLFAKLSTIAGEGVVPNLSKTEYYIDTDPGYGNGTAVNIAPGPTDGTGSFTLDITNMSTGVHLIGIRTKDANGGWSHDNKWLFAKLTAIAGEGAVPKVSRVEYYFDNDPGWGKGTTVAINDGTDLGGIIINANITGLSAAKHKIFYRTQDANGRWSHDNVDTFTLSGVQPIPAITVNSITRPASCAKDSFAISYHATGSYNAGNLFNVELSDATGSFATPLVIGSIADTASNSIIAVKLPSHFPDGSLYRMRVSSTNPVVAGTNSDTLSIHDRPTAQVITGDTSAVVSSTHAYSLPAVTASTWVWSAPAATITQTANTANLVWNTAGQAQAINVIRVNQYGCMGDTSILLVNVYPVSLQNLVVSAGVLTPVFAPDSTSYTDSVGNATTSITVTPTTADIASTVKVNGVTVASGASSTPLPLVVGNNLVTVMVTGRDNTTTRTYTITVSRAASSIASLQNLVVSAGILSPVFAPDSTSYKDSVSNATTSITVTPTTTDNTATVKVNDSTVISGSPSSPIALNPGANTINVVVRAQDGITTKAYTIAVIRATSSPAPLLTQSAVAPAPVSTGKEMIHSSGNERAGIIIYPNPVAGNTFSIRFTHQPAGKYNVGIFSMNGVQVFNKTVFYAGGNAGFEMMLPAFIAEGIYEVRIAAPDNTIKVKKLVVGLIE